MSKNTIAKTRPGVKRQSDESPKDGCTHYWIIETPTGSFSHGTCKLCGADKEFKNFVFYSPWEAQEANGIKGISGMDDDVSEG